MTASACTPAPGHARLSPRRGTRLAHGAVALLVALCLAANGAALATPAQAVNAPLTDLVNENPADFTPHVMNGSVNAITQVGNKMVAAGTFTSVSPAGTFADPSDDLVRNRIFAFDATSGVIDPGFNPNLGGPVNSLDSDGTDVYVGGTFGSVGTSSAIKRVVKLTASGAVVPGFRAVPNSGVNEVVVRGSRLYVGGAFTSVKNRTVTVPRNAFAALNKATGLVDPDVSVAFTGVYDAAIGGATNITRFDVSADGSKLAAVGNFSTVGGQTRGQIALLDTAGTAGVSAWATTRFDADHNDCAGVFDTFMRDVDFSPDGSYLAVSTTGAFAGGAASGTLCDTTSRWETNGTGNNPSWVNYSGGDTTYGVAVTAGAIYVGGHMRWQNNSFQGDNAGPGAVPREGIAALDPVTGLPLSWNPGRSRGVGARAMYASTTGLWVGSDTTRIGKPRETHGRIAFLPLAGGKVIPTVAPAALPGELFLAPRTIATGGAVGTQGELLRRPVDALGSPTGPAVIANSALDWSAVRGAFMINGTVYYGLGDGGLFARAFDEVTGIAGPQRAINLYDDPETGQRIPFAIAQLTGMFFDPATHRLYYTVFGDPRIFNRYFTPESEIVGGQTFVAEANGIDFSKVEGMTLAGGRVLYGSLLDGSLYSVAFTGGRVTGAPIVISSDGTWRYRAIFTPNG